MTHTPKGRLNVEKALMQWGRYSLVIEPSNADLMMTVDSPGVPAVAVFRDLISNSEKARNKTP